MKYSGASVWMIAIIADMRDMIALEREIAHNYWEPFPALVIRRFPPSRLPSPLRAVAVSPVISEII
jgi:hypothetical protein